MQGIGMIISSLRLKNSGKGQQDATRIGWPGKGIFAGPTIHANLFPKGPRKCPNALFRARAVKSGTQIFFLPL
jgi:hypothetical protein